MRIFFNLTTDSLLPVKTSAELLQKFWLLFRPRFGRSLRIPSCGRHSFPGSVAKSCVGLMRLGGIKGIVWYHWRIDSAKKRGEEVRLQIFAMKNDATGFRGCNITSLHGVQVILKDMGDHRVDWRRRSSSLRLSQNASVPLTLSWGLDFSQFH